MVIICGELAERNRIAFNFAVLFATKQIWNKSPPNRCLKYVRPVQRGTRFVIFKARVLNCLHS